MEEASSESDWGAITANRYVAFIDIMGFKDIVMRTQHDDLYKMMEKIKSCSELNSSIQWGQKDGVSNQDLIRTTMYSDSIIIYSKNDSYESLNSIVCTVSGLVSDLFVETIPHKGALSFGKMTLDFKKSIFVGEPLIDAYLLQEELYFYGIVLQGSVERKFDQFQLEGKLFSFTKDYLCNFKNGNSKHLTIYPIYAHPPFKTDPNFKPASDNFYASLGKLRHKTSGNLRKYYDNTELYLNDLQSDY
jgi:hypothetical protein